MDKQSLVTAENKKVGRPTILTEEVVTKLEAAFNNGMSDKTACEYAKISRDTFYRHLGENPEFSDRIRDAKNFIKLLAGKRLVSILKDGKDRDAGPMARWFLERKEPEEYGKTKEIAVQDIEIILPDWYVRANPVPGR